MHYDVQETADLSYPTPFLLLTLSHFLIYLFFLVSDLFIYLCKGNGEKENVKAPRQECE